MARRGYLLVVVTVVVAAVIAAAFFGSVQAGPYDMDATLACLRDRPENISPDYAPSTMPFIINMWGPEVTGTLHESYSDYLAAQTPTGLQISDLFPRGTRGVSIVFIPKSTIDDEGTIWIFPSAEEARHYYEALGGHSRPGDLLVQGNAVIDHPFSSLRAVFRDFPRYDQTQPLLVGCLRR